MNKYQNGKIYKIVDVGYNKCYIGSTCEALSQRMARHRSNYKRYLQGKHLAHTSSFFGFDEFGIQNCKIEWIEDYPCDNKNELARREGYYIKKSNCVNKIVAGRTSEELYQDTHEYQLQRFKDYYSNNRDKGLDRKAQKIKCECGVTHAVSNISRHIKRKHHQEWMKQQEREEEPLQQSD